MQTPNTLAYMIAGFVIFTLVIVFYAASLVMRLRQARRELESYENLQNSQKQ